MPEHEDFNSKYRATADSRDIHYMIWGYLHTVQGTFGTWEVQLKDTKGAKLQECRHTYHVAESERSN